MADLLVAGQVELPRRGKSSGIKRAARMVTMATTMFSQTQSIDAEIDRLAAAYRRQRSRLEEAAKRRLESGEAAAALNHVIGLSRGLPGRSVIYHDRIMAQRIGDIVAGALEAGLHTIDPEALRGASGTRQLAENLEAQARCLSNLVELLHVTGKNLAR